MGTVAAIGPAANQASILPIATKATKATRGARGARRTRATQSAGPTVAAQSTAQTKAARKSGRTKAASNTAPTEAAGNTRQTKAARKSGRTRAAKNTGRTATAMATAQTATARAMTQTTAAIATAVAAATVNRDSISISSAARSVAQSAGMTGSAGAVTSSQSSNRVVQAAAADVASAKSQSVKEQGLDKADKHVNGKTGNGKTGKGNGYGNTTSVDARANQQAVIVASGSRLSAADAAFVNRAKAAQHQDVEGHDDRGNAGKSDTARMRAQFAEARAALMSSMVANSGFRAVGQAVSSRSALDMFRAAGPTLSPTNAIAQYVNSMLMETISSNKGTGIYATLASGVAAASSRVDLLG